MNSSNNYAQRELGVGNTKEPYNTSILTRPFDLVKKRLDRISTSFWRTNYILEENRHEHAVHGHLWKQIGFCLVLLAFRFVGRAIR